MKIFNFLHSYFGFNKRERNGLIILFLIILSMLMVRFYLTNYINDKDELISIKLDPIEKQQLLPAHGKINQIKNKTSHQSELTSEETQRFIFDPNTISKEEALLLGFNNKTANTLLNFREKGGRFEEREDLKKIYGISDDLFEKLKNYIMIEKKEEVPLSKHKKEMSLYSRTSSYELNTMDSIQLVSLPLIGPSTARKILKFRSALGGFLDFDQLKEVYGIKDSVIKILTEKTTLNPSKINPLYVNRATYEELKKHPYINHNMAATIIAYREKHGKYKYPEDLKKIGTIDESVYLKIKGYVNIE